MMHILLSPLAEMDHWRVYPPTGFILSRESITHGSYRLAEIDFCRFSHKKAKHTSFPYDSVRFTDNTNSLHTDGMWHLLGNENTHCQNNHGLLWGVILSTALNLLRIVLIQVLLRWQNIFWLFIENSFDTRSLTSLLQVALVDNSWLKLNLPKIAKRLAHILPMESKVP